MFKYIFFLYLSFVSISNTAAETFIPFIPKIEPGFSPTNNSNLEASLWMVMDKAEHDVKTSPRVIHDRLLNDYLNQIVCKLTPDYCGDIRIYITRTPYFNASMAPNGMMVVWTGLLLRVENEAQIAAILGHELGHYLLRHSLEQFENARSKSSIGAFLTVGLGGIGSLASVALVSSVFAHQRSAEHQADLFGLQLMAEAGYDPYEAPKVWKNIIEETKAAKHKEKSVPFFATHPNPKNRIKKLNSMADEITSALENNNERGELNFNEIVSPYWSLFLEDELKLNQLGKSEFVIANLASTEINPGVVNYYKGELFRLRKKENDYALAEESYNHALSYAEYPYVLHRSLGLIQLKQKRFQEAKNNFTKYLEYVPDAEDKQMIEFYMTMEN